jgi:hypothetical protein
LAAAAVPAQEARLSRNKFAATSLRPDRLLRTINDVGAVRRLRSGVGLILKI